MIESIVAISICVLVVGLLLGLGAAMLSFLPALVLFAGGLWMAFFGWAARMLLVVVLFAVFVCFALQLGPV